jgi:hypothetical protein
VRCTTATSSSHAAMTSSFGSALAITRHGRPCRACPGATSRRSSAHQQQRRWALHLDACKSATSLGERTGRRTQGLPRMLHGPSERWACSATWNDVSEVPVRSRAAQAGHAILSRAE